MDLMAKVKTLGVIFALLVLLLATGYWLLAPGKWDGTSRFTVVEVADVVKVLSFDPKTSRGIEMVLPDNLEVETVAGRGRLLAGNLRPAGSAEWAAASVAYYLGILTTGEKSTLSWGDRLRWWWGARQVQWQELDLLNLGLVEPDTAADQVTVLRLAPTWDQKARQLFSSLSVAQEQLSIKVVNTTEVVGLASGAARGIESSGMKVVEVRTTSNKQLDRCQLVSPVALKKTVGVSLLLHSFGCDWQAGSELILYLGRQYQEFVAGPD